MSNLLERSIESGRVHSAYLLTGPGPAPRSAALGFARALACEGSGKRPCDACDACHRSTQREEIEIDGTGRAGPLFRHVGDHPDLFWVQRGPDDTRVRIGQIRALQHALRLGGDRDKRRVAVIADAEWLNQESQNALLRLLEEPPPRTTLLLVAASSAGLLATVRSRCQRAVFRSGEVDPLDDPENAELAQRLDALGSTGVADLLDWAAEYRGGRAAGADAVAHLLETGSAWLARRVATAAEGDAADVGPELSAHRVLSDCRKSLAQRNANPQMVAERALFALREAAG
jgi:hypothetical protein